MKNVLHSSAIMAALQRSKTYSHAARGSDRKKFRDALKQRLTKLSKKYRRRVTDSEHVANIEDLATKLSTECSQVLYEGRFRIGSAQKALNSYLKYLWCTDKIPTPPHCPFDGIVISKLPSCKRIKWTLLDDISEYKQIVSAARKEAGEKTLAQWELEEFNKAWQ